MRRPPPPCGSAPVPCSGGAVSRASSRRPRPRRRARGALSDRAHLASATVRNSWHLLNLVLLSISTRGLRLLPAMDRLFPMRKKKIIYQQVLKLLVLLRGANEASICVLKGQGLQNVRIQRVSYQFVYNALWAFENRQFV
jgi:hypothetical protein